MPSDSSENENASPPLLTTSGIPAAPSPLRAVGSAILIVVRCIIGWIVGYLVSFISSFSLFVLTHMRADEPTKPLTMLGVTVYCTLFGILGGAIGSQFCRRQAMVIGALFVLTNLAFAAWSWTHAPHSAHWTQFIAIFAISPAALFGAYISRPAAAPVP